MKLTVQSESWPIAGTFSIARGSKTSADVVVVTLEQNGAAGRGECVPYARYEETVPMVLDALAAARTAIEAGITRQDIPTLHLPKAAANALDCALWDMEAKQSGTPAWKSAGLSAPHPVVTAYTLSLDTPEAMAKAARANSHRPLLKLKLGKPGDIERLQLIRAAAPSSTLIVDANEGWSESNLSDMLAACEAVGVALVEQPLPATNDHALASIKSQAVICADESAHGIASLSSLIGKYQAINIKLDKTGGLTEAIALAQAARATNMKIMVGCMLATSLAMAPALLIAQQADFVDLDGPLLLQRDRQPGLVFAGSTINPPPSALWG